MTPPIPDCICRHSNSTERDPLWRALDEAEDDDPDCPVHGDAPLGDYPVGDPDEIRLGRRIEDVDSGGVL